MIAVLFAVSVATFAIFNAIPEGDPAVRLAGRLATPEQIEQVRQQWGFDEPLYTQYLKMMENLFSGEMISYTQQLNVVEEIWRDLPPTLSLTVGAALIWFGVMICSAALKGPGVSIPA